MAVSNIGPGNRSHPTISTASNNNSPDLRIQRLFQENHPTLDISQVPKAFPFFYGHFSTDLNLAEQNYLIALKEVSQSSFKVICAEVVEAGSKLALRISAEKERRLKLFREMFSAAYKQQLFDLCLTLIKNLKKEADQFLQKDPSDPLFDLVHAFYVEAKNSLETLPSLDTEFYCHLLQHLSIYFLKRKHFSSAAKWLHLALSQKNLSPSLELKLKKSAEEIFQVFHAQRSMRDKIDYFEGAIHRAKQGKASLTVVLQEAIDAGNALSYIGSFKEATQIYWLCFHNLESSSKDVQELIEQARNHFQQANAKLLASALGNTSEESPRQKLKKIRQEILQLKGENLGFTMQKHMTEKISLLIQSLAQECEKLLGPKPCDYAFLGLGSLSHAGLSLFSDLEFALLLPTENLQQNRPYFKAFVQLLELKVIELGETTPDKHNSLYLKGFSFDDGGNTPLDKEELIGSASQLIGYLDLLGEGFNDLILVNNLIHSSLVFGSETLYSDYKNQLNAHLNKDNKRVLIRYGKCLLEETVALVSQSLGDPPQLWNNEKFNVKSKLYRMGSFLTLILSKFYQVEDTKDSIDLSSKIDHLCVKGKLHAAIGKRLQELLNFAALLRNLAQTHYKREDETVYVENHNDANHFWIEDPLLRDDLEDLYFTVLIPTYQLLQRLKSQENPFTDDGFFHVQSYAQAHFYQAQIVVAQNNFWRATRLCQKALSFNLDDKTFITHVSEFLGNIAYAEGRWGEAQEAYKNGIGSNLLRLGQTQKAWDLLIKQWETGSSPSTTFQLPPYEDILASEIHPILTEAFGCFAHYLSSLSPTIAQVKFQTVYKELYLIFPCRIGCYALIEAFRAAVIPSLYSLWCRDGFVFAHHQDRIEWQATLNRITSSYSKGILEGVRSGKMPLSPEVLQKIVKDGHIVRFYTHGRRNVAQANNMHFKENPEFPGMEYAIHSLNKLCIGRGSVIHDLCRLSYEGKSFLLLVSESVQGKNLRDLLTNMPHLSIHPTDYSLLFFMALLTNPEDGASSNFIAQDKEGKTFVTCVDNDHVFADKSVTSSLGYKAVVKTILYCLSQLDQPVDKEAQTLFCQLDFLEILSRWLEDLKYYNARVFEFFTPQELSHAFNQQGIMIPIYLKPGLLSKLCYKFSRIKSYLQDHSVATHFELLEFLDPNLASLYKQARAASQNPREIFSAISNQSYKMVQNVEMSLTTSQQMLELTTGQKTPTRLNIRHSSLSEPMPVEATPKEQSTIRLEDPNFSLQIAQRELSNLHYPKGQVNSIREKLIQGNPYPFLNLKDEMFCEKVINRIDFSKLHPQVQVTILNSLIGKSFSKLLLRNCTALDNRLLNLILKWCPNLYHLDISGSSITQIDPIFSNCPKLRRLNLSHSTKLKVFDLGIFLFNRHLPELKALHLQGCSSLEILFLPPGLEELNLSHARPPQITPKMHPSLRFLNVSGMNLYKTNVLHHSNVQYTFPQLEQLTYSENEIQKTRLYNKSFLSSQLVVLTDGTLVSGPAFGKTIGLWNLWSGKYLRSLEGHTDNILTLKNLPDETVISGSFDKTIKVWNTKTGECLRTLLGHTAEIRSLKVLDDSTVVSATNKTIKVWNVKTGECLCTLEPSALMAVKVLNDNLLISKSSDNTSKLWNAKTGQCLQTIKHQLDHINKTFLAVVGGKLITFENGKLKFWDLDTKLENSHTLSCNNVKQIYTLKMLADERLVIAYSSNREYGSGYKIDIVSPRTGKSFTILEHGQNTVINMTILADRILVIVFNDQTIKFWDFLTKTWTFTLNGSNKSPNSLYEKTTAVKILDERTFIFRSNTNTEIWRVDKKAKTETGCVDPESKVACLRTYRGQLMGINAFTTLANGTAVSGSIDGTIKLWDMQTGSCLQTLTRNWQNGSSFTSLARLADGTLVSGSEDGTIDFWDPQEGTYLANLSDRFTKESQWRQNLWDISHLAALVVLKNEMLVNFTKDNTIKIWDLQTRECLGALSVTPRQTQPMWGEIYPSKNSTINPALALLSDGTFVSGYKYEIKLWDLKTQKCLRTIDTRSHLVCALAVLEDGTLITGDSGGLIKLWNPLTGECLRTLERESDRKARDLSYQFPTYNYNHEIMTVSDLRVLADGTLFSIYKDEIIKIWDPMTGACLRTFKGQIDLISALALLPEGTQISTSVNGPKLWDPTTGAYLRTLEQSFLEEQSLNEYFWHENLWDISFTDNILLLADSIIVNGRHGQDIKCWDPQTGACLRTLEDSDRITSLMVLDEQTLVGASHDKINIWNSQTGKCLHSLPHLHTVGVCALTTLSNGKFASASHTEIKIWDSQTGRCLQTFCHLQQRGVSVLTMLNDGTLVTGFKDEIKIWDTQTGKCLKTLEKQTGLVDLLVLEEGTLISIYVNKTVKQWDPQTGTCLWTLDLQGYAHFADVLRLVVERMVSQSVERPRRWSSHFKKYLYLLEQNFLIKPFWNENLWDIPTLINDSEDQLIKLWKKNVELAQLRHAFCSMPKSTPSFESFRNERWFRPFLTETNLHRRSYRPKTIPTWDIVKTGHSRTFKQHYGAVYALLVLADGTLVSGSEDMVINLWNVKTGSCLRSLEGHSGDINALFSLADGTLASGSEDKVIKLWNIKTGECLHTLEGHSRGIYVLIETVDGTLISGSADKTIKLWNVKTGECLHTLEGHAERISALALLTNGILVSGSKDGIIKFWNLETGTCLQTLNGHLDDVTALIVQADKTFISGSADGTFKQWQIDTSVVR